MNNSELSDLKQDVLTMKPKHRSWLNMAEIELNVLMNGCLNRKIENIETIKKEATRMAKIQERQRIIN